MSKITVGQIKHYIDEHDKTFGSSYGMSTVLYYLNRPTLGYRIKDFYNTLNTDDLSRELVDTQLFRLGKLLQETVNASSPQLPTLKVLCESFGQDRLEAIAYLTKFDMYNVTTFDTIMNENDPMSTVRLMNANRLIKESGLAAEEKNKAYELVKNHSSPDELALGLKCLALPGYELFNNRNINAILNSSDPGMKGLQIMKQAVCPTMSDDDLLQGGLIGRKAKIYWHLDRDRHEKAQKKQQHEYAYRNNL